MIIHLLRVRKADNYRYRIFERAITIHTDLFKKELIQKMLQGGLRSISLQGAVLIYRKN